MDASDVKVGDKLTINGTETMAVTQVDKTTKEINNEGLHNDVPVLVGNTADPVVPLPAGTGEVSKPLDSPDLGASKSIEQPKPTRKQIGEWRSVNFTVRHSTVLACGHNLDLRHFPSNANCFDCWEAFFSVSPEGVASVHNLLLKEGTQSVIRMHGKKFTKMFGEFLRKKLLSEYENREAPAASGIEGSVMDIKAESEASLGVR